MEHAHSGQLHQGTPSGFCLHTALPGVDVGGAAVRHRERPQLNFYKHAALAGRAVSPQAAVELGSLLLH